MIEVSFVVSESLKDVARSVGIPTGPGPEIYPCPLAVGDLISYPASPSIAFRVSWRLYSHGSDAKPPRWLLGLEKADHPLVVPQ
jgi:hypothetical protein